MYRFTLGDKSVHFDDLNPDVFAEVARATPGLTWWDAYSQPLGDIPVARALIKRLAEHLEVDAPSTEIVRDFMGLFTPEILDDTPTEYEDGHPLAEAEPTTAG